MRKRKAVVYLGMLCVIAAILLVMDYLAKDRIGPEIILPDTIITVTENQDYSTLLAGVQAVDERDGDVSDQLIVENIYLSGDGRTANIIYAAMDDSYNVTKAVRNVAYVRILS